MMMGDCYHPHPNYHHHHHHSEEKGYYHNDNHHNHFHQLDHHNNNNYGGVVNHNSDHNIGSTITSNTYDLTQRSSVGDESFSGDDASISPSSSSLIPKIITYNGDGMPLLLADATPIVPDSSSSSSYSSGSGYIFLSKFI